MKKKRITSIIALILLCAEFFLIGYSCAYQKYTNKPTEVVPEVVTEPSNTEEVVEEPTPEEPVLDELVKTEPVKPTTAKVVVEEPPVESDYEGTLIGSDFTLYHYAPTGNATASGRMPVAGLTVAVDPRYIKLGTWLKIEIPDGNGGYTVYRHKVRADDTGGAIKGHVIDVFVGSESEAIQCGVIRNARVYIVEE